MSRRPPVPSRRRLLAGLAALCLAPGAWAAVDPAELKAVFLVRFLRYVDVGEGSAEALDAVVVGAPDVAAALRRVGSKLGGGRVREHGWEALPAEGLDGARVLFVRGEVAEAKALIASLPAGVLVVGDDRALLEAGAALAFFWEKDRLRFAADQAMAEARGVRLGAELLRLAEGRER